MEVADAPLGQCPVHPQKPAWRVCRRCGRFLCAQCTFPTPQGPLCEPCVAFEPAKAEGFTGLMMLALVGLIAVPLFTLSEAAALLPPYAGPVSMPWLLLAVPHAVIAVCTLPLYVMKRRIARYLMLGFYGVAIASAASDLGSDRFAPYRVGIGIGWLAYFGMNDRVKRVLVK